MPLNLLFDAWIPVATTAGSRVIRPHQLAEPNVLFPAWPRPDLNIACVELLIGLVALADPPADPEEWLERAPEPERLRERLAPFAGAFELGGEGPRFLQDLETLAGEPGPPDMLFIDSAGENAARKNADLMVWRNRYPALDPALAAMALFALQAYAPEGGRGIRTSLRGGGPLVTLVEPGPHATLGEIVWANVPCRRPRGPEVLPWMRPTRISDKGETIHENQENAIEAYFGMPRRLRLVFDEDLVTGVIQRPYGTNYGLWRHPLTPYYRMKAGAEAMPRHPRAGVFGYRNWLGVVAKAEKADLQGRAAAVDDFLARVPPEDKPAAQVIMAGWAMTSNKPRDFTWSRQPLVDLAPEKARMLEGMIEAAEAFGTALRQALKSVAGEGSALESQREEFFLRTEGAFHARLDELRAGGEAVDGWLQDMRKAAMAIFDANAVPGLADRRIVRTKAGARAETGAGAIVAAREFLRASFAGHGKFGQEAFGALGLPPPETKGRRKAGGVA